MSLKSICDLSVDVSAAILVFLSIDSLHTIYVHLVSLSRSSSFSSVDGLVGLVLDKTSFYYESGGQVCDTGVFLLGGSLAFTVTSVQTYGGYVVHCGHVAPSASASHKLQVKVGDAVELNVDYIRRSFVAPNHTMTHVLNYALRTVFAETPEGKTAIDMGLCEQKGSLVDADKLRFDFSWSQGLTSTQLARVEAIVVERIQAQLPVSTAVVPLQAATKIHALRKVFGETYPDPVRVVSVGVEVEQLLNEVCMTHRRVFSFDSRVFHVTMSRSQRTPSGRTSASSSAVALT